MLPIRLCELCSLTPNEDKLTFSVFVTLDENADVVDHRFAKTVMRSCTQLAYAHAQVGIEFPRCMRNFCPSRRRYFAFVLFC